VARRRAALTVSVVLDASVAGVWALPDESDGTATAALHHIVAHGGIVSSLFPWEIRNILVMAERRRRLEPQDADAFLADIADLPIEVDLAAKAAAVVALARTHRLSVYDALYLELARRRRLPLATLDRALLAAARAEGVAVFGA
jgi:predicted nucleic acid-binding protein